MRGKVLIKWKLYIVGIILLLIITNRSSLCIINQFKTNKTKIVKSKQLKAFSKSFCIVYTPAARKQQLFFF